MEVIEMQTIGSIINQSMSKELDSKLDKVCSKCGEPLYKDINILGKMRRVPKMCRCMKEAYEQERIKQANIDKQINIQRLIKNSLMDGKFKSSTFENWNHEKGNKQMYELGLRYANKFLEAKKEGLGLMIYGEPGNGKTYLVSAIANKLIESQIPVICVNIEGLLSRIRETYSKWGKEAESDIIRGLQNADLLIIDDLGTEQISDWSQTRIYNIIDGRYRQGLPLIITSNLDIKVGEKHGALAERYGERTEDRIFEMCTPILNRGKSIRIDQAKRNTNRIRDLLYKED